MAAEIVPKVILNSGYEMPILGLGTAAVPLPPPEQVTSILVDAIEVGYRHFDTAALYGSEESLGRAVVGGVRRGFIRSRGEVFITSKLPCTHTHPDLVLPALKDSLRKLVLEYLDLYLIHFPITLNLSGQINLGSNLNGQDVVPFDMRGTWEAMEECCRLGLTKSIGVSNFTCAKLSTLLRHAKIPPAVNQVEMNVSWQQQKLQDFCKNNGNIHVSAWSPLGGNGVPWGSAAVMESSVLKQIASAKQKTLAQVALRWVYEQGASVIVKSFSKERMKENLEIFDWELSVEEKHEIEHNIPQKRASTAEEYFVHPNGFYKTVEELWDGEL